MRKLAVAAFSFSAAVLLCVYLLPPSWRLYSAAVVAAIALSGLFLKKKTRLFILISGLAVAVGILWCFAYDAMLRIPAAELSGQTVTLSAKVEDFPEKRDYGWRVTVSVRPEAGLPVKTYLYVFDDSPAALKPGDTVRFSAEFTEANEMYGDETEAYRSKGIFLFASAKGSVETERQSGQILYFPRYIAEAIRNKTAEIFPKDTAAFIQALLLGDNILSFSSPSLAGNMKEVGVYHVIAVSGMHVVFLAGLVTALFGKRRTGSLLSMAVTILFMAMTGFTPSIVRAGIMLIFVFAAPLVKREYDPITALAFALLLILLANPYSAAGYGLQFSFAATLGMMLFTGRAYAALDLLPKKKGKLKSKAVKKIYRYIIVTMSATIGASIFTVPLSALYYGYVSIIAPLSNLLLLWLVEAAFVAGIIACAVGFLFAPVGVAAAWVASLPVRAAVLGINALAKFPIACIYTENAAMVIWLVYVYLMFVVVSLFKGGKRRYVVPGAAAVISLCIALIFSSVAGTASGMTVTVLDVGQGQCIVVTSGSSTAMIDCGSSSGEDAGAIAVNYLKSQGRNTIDLLILTHFHEDHAGGVLELFESVNISALVIPELEATESSIEEDIIQVAKSNDTDILYVSRNMTATLSQVQLTVYPPVGKDSENERCISILCSEDEYDTLITGDMPSKLENILVLTEDLPDIELLVVGHHGSKTSTGQELLDAVKPETAIISVGENSYGHPTEEVLDRLESAGIEVYRTDVSGNITLRARQ